MTFGSSNTDTKAGACHIRSNCKRESDSKYFKELFEHEWDYFVVKTNANTGEYRGHIECCGRLAEYGNA